MQRGMLRRAICLVAGATLGVLVIYSAAEAMSPGAIKETARERTLRLLPTQDDLLVNLDPAELPSTSDMVRLGRRVTPAIINGLVNSMSPRVRSSCATVLTATRDPRANEALADALDDPNSGVKHMALQALGVVESRAATDKMLALIRKPGMMVYVRDAAMKALGRTGDPKAVRPLLKIFEAEGSSAAQRALWDMRRGLERGQIERLIVGPLERAAEGELAGSVVEFAVERAGDLRLRDAVDPLVELYDELPYLQNRIVYNLGRIGDRSVVKFLKSKLDRTGEARLLNNVTFALQRLKVDVTPFLREALADRRAYIRFNAAFVAGDLGMPELVNPLVAALSDPNDYVKSEAARALGRIGDVRATDALEPMLNLDNAVVRGDALLALAHLDYDRWRDRVVSDLLTGKSSLNRTKAAQFLADRPDKTLVEPVLSALSPAAYSNAALALSYLDQFSDLDEPTATAWLLRAASGGAHRHQAFVLLGRFADERSRFVLRQWLSQPGGEQNQLLRAMGRLRDAESRDLARRWFTQNRDIVAQLHAAFFLASLGDSEAASHLVRALEEGPVEMKRTVARLFTELDLTSVPDAAARLGQMLDHDDVYVRLYAAKSLIQSNDSKAFSRLKSEVDKRIPFIRDEVLDIVERAPPAYSVPVLKSWSESDRTQFLRRDIDRILARI